MGARALAIDEKALGPGDRVRSGQKPSSLPRLVPQASSKQAPLIANCSPEFDDDEEVPPMVLLLAAIIVKLKDQDWLDDTMAALDDQ